MEPQILRSLIDARDRAIQKARIAFGNRLDAIEDGRDTADPMTIDMLQKWFDLFREAEEDIDHDIRTIAQDFPIIEEMCAIPGINLILAAKLVSQIDITRANTVSAFWRFCGMGVRPWCQTCEKILEAGVEVCPVCKEFITEHRAERLMKGEEAHHSQRAKTYAYQIAVSIIRQYARKKNAYGELYYKSKDYYEGNRPDWEVGRKDNAARRRMIKMFLSHMWVTWRTLEGLPVTEPYVHDKLGHNHRRTPEQFGWNKIAAKTEETKQS